MALNGDKSGNDESDAARLDGGLDARLDGSPNGSPAGPARLGALRDELKRRDLDGFIVARSDEHQGEYVAPGSERLAWLTGFTGSAGLAIVLAGKAAVFIDGRYTLQAEKEVDGGLFEHCHLTDRPPAGWIADNLDPGARLGFDPWLLTPVQADRFRAACKKAGGELVAADGNPVDAVWTNQPAAALSPVVAHDDAFAGESSNDKRRRIADGLKADKADAVVLTAPDSIAWLLNIRGNDVPFSPLALSFCILHADAKALLFMDGRKLAPGTVDHLGPDVGTLEPDAFGPALDRLGQDAKTVRVSAEAAPQWVFDRLEKAGAVIERGDEGDKKRRPDRRHPGRAPARRRVADAVPGLARRRSGKRFPDGERLRRQAGIAAAR